MDKDGATSSKERERRKLRRTSSGENESRNTQDHVHSKDLQGRNEKKDNAQPTRVRSKRKRSTQGQNVNNNDKKNNKDRGYSKQQQGSWTQQVLWTQGSWTQQGTKRKGSWTQQGSWFTRINTKARNETKRTARNETKRIVDTARLMITRILTKARNETKRTRPEITNNENANYKEDAQPPRVRRTKK